MGDILGASSLLLGILGVLYGLWYSNLIDILQTDVPKHAANRIVPRKRVTTILLSRAFPLTFGSTAIAAAFFPEAYTIFMSAVVAIETNGLDAFSGYDTVKTAIVIVELFTVFLALHLLWLTISIVRLRHKLASSQDTSA